MLRIYSICEVESQHVPSAVVCSGSGPRWMASKQESVIIDLGFIVSVLGNWSERSVPSVSACTVDTPRSLMGCV